MIINDKIVNTWNNRFDRIEQSQNDDRRDIDKIYIELKTIHEQNERILGMQNRSQGKIKDAVEDATDPLKEAMEHFIDKKVLKVDNNKLENLSIWKKIQFWNRKKVS